MDSSTTTSSGNSSVATNSKKKQIVVEAMWLQYINDYLLREKRISPTMHRKMRLEISIREDRQLQEVSRLSPSQTDKK